MSRHGIVGGERPDVIARQVGETLRLPLAGPQVEAIDVIRAGLTGLEETCATEGAERSRGGGA